MVSACFTLLVLVARPTVTSTSDCPSGRDIENRLSVLLPEQTALPGSATVLLSADGLLIELQPENPAFAAQRSVTVGRNCEQRAEAAAVIIATWWPTAPTEASATRAVPEKQRKGHRLALATGGLVSLVSGSVAPGAQVEASFVPGPRGFGVRLAADGTFAHEEPLGQGRVSWSRASLALGPVYAQGFLRFDAGVVGSFLWVGGSGFTENRKESGVAAGFTLGARASVSWGHVRAWLELRGLAWPQTQQLVANDGVTGLSSHRPLPHFECQLGAGVAFSLF